MIVHRGKRKLSKIGPIFCCRTGMRCQANVINTSLHAIFRVGAILSAEGIKPVVLLFAVILIAQIGQYLV